MLHIIFKGFRAQRKLKTAASAGLAFCLLASVTACANTPAGQALEESLAVDPRLQETTASPSPTSVATSSPSSTTAELPADFPEEIPRYTNAQLIETIEPSSPAAETQLRWRSSDPSNYIQNFYQQAFEREKWKLISQPMAGDENALVAELNNLRVRVSFVPDQPAGVTEFLVEYGRVTEEIAASPSPTNSPSPSPTVSASPSPEPASQTSPAPTSETANQIPEELRAYVADLTQLGVLKLGGNKPESSNNTSLPEPNKVITRAEYVRWLVAANNQIFANQPAKQIRLGVPSSEPVFSDVPATHPDFPAIQGLAEAGIIPSKLSGDKAVQFRPASPLTREAMLLWKVPLDTRQVLPTASIDGVKERWGFQDASKIDTSATRAVLADFNNKDLSNIRRVFGFTTLFQPKKSVTRAEAAASLWYFGVQGEGLSAKDALEVKSQTNQTGGN